MADENKVPLNIESQYNDKGMRDAERDAEQTAKKIVSVWEKYAPEIKRLHDLANSYQGKEDFNTASVRSNLGWAKKYAQAGNEEKAQASILKAKDYMSGWAESHPLHASMAEDSAARAQALREATDAAMQQAAQEQAVNKELWTEESLLQEIARNEAIRNAEAQKNAANTAKSVAETNKELNARKQFNAILGSVAEYQRKAAESAKKAAKAAAQQQAQLRLSAQAVKALQTGFRGVTNSIKPLQKSMNNLVSRFKGIALSRVIRKFLTGIEHAFKTGFENLYAYSEIFSTRFKKSMDLLATDALYVKNSLGALAEPIINTLAPVVDYLTDKFVDLLNTINQVIAALSGQSAYTKAIKYPTEYAGAATKAAKANQLWLGSFDELNRISESGGGSSKENLDYSRMFEEADISTTLQDIIDNGKWEEAGQSIAAKINNIVDRVKESNIGQKLGEKLNNAVSFGLGFLTELDAENAGFTLGEKIKEFVETVEWEEVGSFIWTKFQTAIEFFKGLLKSNPLPGVATALGETLKGALDSATKWLKGQDWAAAGHNLADTIVEIGKQTPWREVWTAIWEFARQFVFSGFASLLGAISQALRIIAKKFEDNGHTSVYKWINKLADTIDDVATDLQGDGQKAASYVREGMNQEWAAAEDDADSFLDRLKKKFSEFSVADILKAAFDSGVKALFKANGYGPILNIAGFAGGGTVDTGQLFIANESGPELVGQIGGKTTVTNQEQFTAGLAAANEGVIQAVLAAANAINSTLNSKNYTVELDGKTVSRELYSSLNRESARRGTSLAWGE